LGLGGDVQLAIHEGACKEAFKGGKGTCPLCGAIVNAKCGPRVLHHWAHVSRRNCDPWWENETAWHREWKNKFPESFREISQVAADGEIHRADIKTPRGIVVEIQHSAITDDERVSREKFYRNLVWVIDGREFQNRFTILHPLPDPSTELGKDLVWYKARRHQHGSSRGIFFRLSENRVRNPTLSKSSEEGRMVRVHGWHEIEEEVVACYRGHHQYDWMRPHSTWLESASPVFVDFGTDMLVTFETYDESGLECIRYVAKEQFVRDVMTLEMASDIGKLVNRST
jgi:competence protein CoiA